MKLTIRTKLIVGCALMLSFTAAMGGIALYGKSVSETATSELGEMATDLSIGADSATAMLMVRMNVKDFLINNEPREIEQYDQWASDLRAAIELSKESFQNPERARLIREIETDFQTYDTAFSEVQSVINERNELVGRMYNYGAKTRRSLSESYDRAVEAGDFDGATVAADATKQLLLARLYAYRYVKTSDPADAENFTKWAGTLASTLQGVDAENFVADDFATAAAGIDDYMGAFATVKTLVQRRNELVLGTLDVVGPQIRDKGVAIKNSLIASVDEERANADAEAAIVRLRRMLRSWASCSRSAWASAWRSSSTEPSPPPCGPSSATSAPSAPARPTSPSA